MTMSLEVVLIAVTANCFSQNRQSCVLLTLLFIINVLNLKLYSVFPRVSVLCTGTFIFAIIFSVV